MLRKNAPLFRFVNIVVDLLIVALSFISAVYIFSLSRPEIKIDLPNYFGLGIFVLAVSGLVFYLLKFYSSRRTFSVWEDFKFLALGVFYVLTFLSVYAFLFKVSSLHRYIIVSFSMISFSLLFLLRVATKLVLSYYRQAGYNFREVLIIGVDHSSRRFIQKLKNNPSWGYKVLGFISYDKRYVGRELLDCKILSDIDNISKVIAKNTVDKIFISVSSATTMQQVRKALEICEIEGIDTCIITDSLRVNKANVDIFDLGPVSVVEFSTKPKNQFALFFKRVIDIIGSLFGLIFLAPLFMMTAILICLDSKGPVLFKQKRVGINGREFTFYKFRTMVVNAEELKAKLQAFNEMDGPVFKIKDDPRITKVGKFLRKTSIDELPQLLNVLKGEMSLVGPRPPVPDEVKKYTRWQRRRLSMKPGLTCLWQVSGRNKIGFEDWMKLDLQYIDNWSLLLDIKLIAKTIPVVLVGTGV